MLRFTPSSSPSSPSLSLSRREKLLTFKKHCNEQRAVIYGEMKHIKILIKKFFVDLLRRRVLKNEMMFGGTVFSNVLFNGSFITFRRY